MSCISEILKIKGNNAIMPFPENPSIVIEGGGVYKDYEFLITFTDMGHRCGYVAINPDHPLYGKDCLNYDADDGLSVHGGITFHQEEHSIKKLLSHPCKDEWLGFDAAHGSDLPCHETTEKYFGSTSLTEFYKNNSYPRIYHYAKHRTFRYMKRECMKLINQLIEIKKVA